VNAGAILWEGASQINHEPVVAIATGLDGTVSQNGKTGKMAQTWILHRDVPPAKAVSSGDDEAVCGDCIHRAVGGIGTCYVNVGTAPNNIWRAYKRGAYERRVRLEYDKLGPVRIGSYGDPVAAPLAVWEQLAAFSDNVTGYTHQWQREIAQPYRSLLMASVDDEAQGLRAAGMGWRPFLTVPIGGTIPHGYAWCPSDKSNPGEHIGCEDCGACDGGRGRRKTSIAIYAHGQAAAAFGNKERRPAGLPVLNNNPPSDPVLRVPVGLRELVKIKAKADGQTMKRWVEGKLRAALDDRPRRKDRPMLDLNLEELSEQLRAAHRAAGKEVMDELDKHGLGDSVRYFLKHEDAEPEQEAEAPKKKRKRRSDYGRAKPRKKKPRHPKASTARQKAGPGGRGGKRNPTTPPAWRKKVLREVMKQPKHSSARADAVAAIADKPIEWPDGEMRPVPRTSIALWARQIEAGQI